MASIFTTADRDAVKTALIEAAVSGVASCTVAGQTVQARTVDELRRLLEVIQADLASSANNGGIRWRALVPGGCG